MTFKKIVKAFSAFCAMAILWVAICACEDLGAYGNEEEYCASFGDIVLISGTSREKDEYSVTKYFYNKESKEDFLEGEDGAYKGVGYSDYVYMAIPFESNIEMDSLALYIKSQSDVSVYINVFVTDKIPSEWKAISDNEINEGESTEESEEEEKTYDDPDDETRIGSVTVHLNKEEWGSFVLERFNIDGAAQESIEIKDGQYVLLQIRNNSGVCVFSEEKQAYVDPQTGIELQKAEITMTNLLIRASSRTNAEEAQGGE